MKWPIKKLGDVLKISRGGSPRPIENYLTEDVNGLNWIKIGDVEVGAKYITQTKERIKKEGLKKTRKVYVGDFLLSNSMSFGRPYITKIDGCIHDGWLTLKDESKIFDTNFLYHVLGSNAVKEQFQKYASGAVVKNLNVDAVSKVVIAIPPLAEQQRIAALLDTADRILKQRELAIAKLDQLAQSVFVEMFSNDTKYECEEVTLGDCLRFINGRAYSQNELLDAGTPVIRIQNLNGGDRWYYSNLNLPENKYCDYGDLLFAWSASFGPYIWNGKKSIYHYHIWKIETTKKIDKTFAFYLLQSITQKIRNASHGVSMLHMTKSGMEAWKIKLPSLAYQMKFVDFINQLQPIETAYKKNLQLMTDNTRSIQHQSFAVN